MSAAPRAVGQEVKIRSALAILKSVGGADAKVWLDQNGPCFDRHVVEIYNRWIKKDAATSKKFLDQSRSLIQELMVEGREAQERSTCFYPESAVRTCFENTRTSQSDAKRLRQEKQPEFGIKPLVSNKKHGPHYKRANSTPLFGEGGEKLKKEPNELLSLKDTPQKIKPWIKDNNCTNSSAIYMAIVALRAGGVISFDELVQDIADPDLWLMFELLRAGKGTPTEESEQARVRSVVRLKPKIHHLAKNEACRDHHVWWVREGFRYQTKRAHFATCSSCNTSFDVQRNSNVLKEEFFKYLAKLQGTKGPGSADLEQFACPQCREERPCREEIQVSSSVILIEHLRQDRPPEKVSDPTILLQEYPQVVTIGKKLWKFACASVSEFGPDKYAHQLVLLRTDAGHIKAICDSSPEDWAKPYPGATDTEFDRLYINYVLFVPVEK